MCFSSFLQIPGKFAISKVQMKYKVMEQHHQPFSFYKGLAFHFLIVEEKFLTPPSPKPPGFEGRT